MDTLCRSPATRAVDDLWKTPNAVWTSCVEPEPPCGSLREISKYLGTRAHTPPRFGHILQRCSSLRATVDHRVIHTIHRADEADDEAFFKKQFITDGRGEQDAVVPRRTICGFARHRGRHPAHLLTKGAQLVPPSWAAIQHCPVQPSSRSPRPLPELTPTPRPPAHD